GLANYNVAVREWQGEVVFLHQIVPGAADKSYGIHVAQLAGVPREVNERAEAILQELERGREGAERKLLGENVPANGKGDGGRPRRVDGAHRNGAAAGRFQLTLFETRDHPLLDLLRNVDLENLSPR